MENIINGFGLVLSIGPPKQTTAIKKMLFWPVTKKSMSNLINNLNDLNTAVAYNHKNKIHISINHFWEPSNNYEKKYETDYNIKNMYIDDLHDK